MITVRTSVSSKRSHQPLAPDENFDRQEEVRQRQEEQKRRSGDQHFMLDYSSFRSDNRGEE